MVETLSAYPGPPPDLQPGALSGRATRGLRRRRLSRCLLGAHPQARRRPRPRPSGPSSWSACASGPGIPGPGRTPATWSSPASARRTLCQGMGGLRRLFTVEELRDLQVWFNLAWFDPEPWNATPLADLVARGRDFGEEDKRDPCPGAEHDILAATSARVSGGGRRGPDRAFHLSLLPSHPAAARQHRLRPRVARPTPCCPRGASPIRRTPRAGRGGA